MGGMVICAFDVEDEVKLKGSNLYGVILGVIKRPSGMLYEVGYWVGDDYRCTNFYDFEMEKKE